MYPVVILAGGLATRLRPLTESVPKALIEVANTPFISWQLKYLHFQGVSSVLICLGYLGSMIEEFIGDGAGYGLDIQYSYEDKQLLGTGGAINQALHLLPEDFFILYGDSFLPINFNDVQKCYIDRKRMGLMTVLKNQNQVTNNLELRIIMAIEVVIALVAVTLSTFTNSLGLILMKQAIMKNE